MDNILMSILPSLHEGSNRIQCPYCNGGSSRERSFAITKDGDSYAYICHRASCNARGKYRGKRSIFADKPAVRKKQEVITKPNPAHYKARVVRDCQGEIQGFVYRRNALAPKSLPKDINALPEGYPKLHFPTPPREAYMMLVEDIPSSEVMDRWMPCCALLGTNLNEEKIEVLLSCGIRKLYIALDNDATLKARALARKYLIDTQIVVLQQDIKDMPLANVIRLASELEEGQ